MEKDEIPNKFNFSEKNLSRPMYPKGSEVVSIRDLELRVEGEDYFIPEGTRGSLKTPYWVKDNNSVSIHWDPWPDSLGGIYPFLKRGLDWRFIEEIDPSDF